MQGNDGSSTTAGVTLSNLTVTNPGGSATGETDNATIDFGSPTNLGSGYLIFDYSSPTDYKYAGIRNLGGQREWVIGHVDATGMHDDATLTEGVTQTATHTYADNLPGNAPYTVTATAFRGTNSYTAAPLSVPIYNVPPKAAVTGPGGWDAGILYALNIGPVVDPGHETVSEYRLFWGDGSTFGGNAYESFSSGGTNSHLFTTPFTQPLIQVQVVNQDGVFNIGEFFLTVNEQPTSALQPGQVPGVLGQPSSSNLIVMVNGTLPFTVISASGLPPGLTVTVNGNTVTLSGTPTAIGTFNGQIVIADAAGVLVTQSFSVTIQAPLSVSVAFTPEGQEVLVVVSGNGVLTQFDASGAHTLATGIRSAGVGITPLGQEVLLIVYTNDILMQYDATGSQLLASDVRAASVAFTPLGQEVLLIVYTNGILMQYDATGSQLLASDVRSASVAFAPDGQEVLLIVYTNGIVVQYDAAGSHSLLSGVAAAAVAFPPSEAPAPVPESLGSANAVPPSEQEVLDAIFADGGLFQFDATGTHWLASV